MVVFVVVAVVVLFMLVALQQCIIMLVILCSSLLSVMEGWGGDVCIAWDSTNHYPLFICQAHD